MEELDEERRLHTSQAHELKFEIDRLRKAKKEQEARFAGVDPDAVKSTGDQAVRLEEELQKAREEHSREIAEMRSRLQVGVCRQWLCSVIQWALRVRIQ